MAIKDILLQLDSYPERTPDAAIDAAVAFAAGLGARIAALAVQVDIPLARNALADRLIHLSALEKEWEADSLEGCRAAIARFDAQARAAGVFAGSEIRKIDLYEVDDAVARLSRTRDLCMAPLADRYDGQLELAQQVVFGAGRPVLAFSAGRAILPTGQIGNVAVAWDGSRAAARALGDALPILGHARSVRIVTFVGEKAAAQAGLGADVIRHLADHGITAAADEVDAAGKRIGQAMDDYLASTPADLLVMGAYGHSRMRELVLGGATEHALRSLPTALFLSH